MYPAPTRLQGNAAGAWHGTATERVPEPAARHDVLRIERAAPPTPNPFSPATRFDICEAAAEYLPAVNRKNSDYCVPARGQRFSRAVPPEAAQAFTAT